MGIPIDTVYDCLPKSAIMVAQYEDGVRTVHIPVLKRTSPIRKRMIDYIFDCCSKNEYVFPRALTQASGVSMKTITEEEIVSNYIPGAASFPLAALHVSRSPQRRVENIPDKITDIPLKQSGRDIFCDTAIRSVFTRIIAAGKAEDEYAALLYCVRLGAESLNSQ